MLGREASHQDTLDDVTLRAGFGQLCFAGVCLRKLQPFALLHPSEVMKKKSMPMLAAPAAAAFRRWPASAEILAALQPPPPLAAVSRLAEKLQLAPAFLPHPASLHHVCLAVALTP